ncbi:MAG: hypothetical protein K8T10_04570 [Candidatus Eremiobacteraeota bacterium]|nr:hypothetical protein [Candidatus Eremiobacteraeota bacterium]
MSQLWQLYRMNQLDTEKDKKTIEKDKLMKPDQLEKECKELEKELEEFDEKKKKLHLKMKKSELETDGVVNHRKKLEKKIYDGKTKNPKELLNWQLEIEHLKKKQEEKEDLILEMMEKMESIEEHKEDNKQLIKEKEKEIKTANRSYKSELKRLESEMSDMEANKEKIAKTVEENLLKKYEQLRRIMKDHMAVAKIKGEICGGCFTNLPDSMIKQVQAHHLVTCNNCMRILYWEDKKEDTKEDKKKRKKKS